MAWILIVHIVHTLNSSVWNSQEESRMENKSYFFGGNITFFAIPFCGIGESISGWMNSCCLVLKKEMESCLDLLELKMLVATAGNMADLNSVSPCQ